MVTANAATALNVRRGATLHSVVVAITAREKVHTATARGNRRTGVGVPGHSVVGATRGRKRAPAATAGGNRRTGLALPCLRNGTRTINPSASSEESDRYDASRVPTPGASADPNGTAPA